MGFDAHTNMTSTLVSTADLAQHLETTLKATDDELGRLIDSADSAIQRTYGPHVDGERTVKLENQNYSHNLFLPYPPAESIEEIKEYASYELSSKAEVVLSTEYEMEYEGRVVRRPEKRFMQKVIVRYTPVDDSADRIHILIDLVRLSDQYSGVKSEEFGIGRSGGAATEHLDYTKEWNRILNRMRPFAPGIMFV